MDTHYYTVIETAELLRVSVSTVRRAVASGALHTTRIGRRGQIRVGQTSLDAYLSPELEIRQTPIVDGRPTQIAPQSDGPCVEFDGTTADGATWRVLNADVMDGLRRLEAQSVNCIVTSPPYYWQRDYEVRGQIGHESTIDGYVDALVDTFVEAKRVLADDGLLFLNLGDTYYSAKGRAHGFDKKHTARQISRKVLRAVDGPGLGLPRKSLIGIPWRVALALQESGWTLRSAIIWYRPASLPEATSKDRPWRTYEHVFMFAKQPRYWFDRKQLKSNGDVWTLTARPENPGSHFAPYPVELVDRCLAAGCKPRGAVLDPFVGSGTTMTAALRRGMSAVGIELKPEYCAFVRKRLNEEFKGRSSLVREVRRRA